MTSPATVPQPFKPARFLFPRHLLALALRHLYLCVESWPRLIEIMYWPTINILMQGFISLYVAQKMGVTAASVATIFIAGALFCEVLLRTGQGMMILFMEEVWSRNLGHLFASPLPFFHYSFSIMLLGFTRMAIAIIPAAFISAWLFNFNMFDMGVALAYYIPLLILNGWWMGLLIISMILWLGLAAEWLTWMSIWLLIPMIAPYYPVSVLPPLLQYVSWSLPATYVFESIKSLITTHELHGDYLVTALFLNIGYLIAAGLIFNIAHRNARRQGRLLQNGE